MGKNRDVTIDCVKGICIILVVVGHSGFLYTNFIYLFHMAVFIMCSGFFFKTILLSKDLLENIFKKIKKLWFPNWLWMSIFTVLNNIFLFLNIYTDNVDIIAYNTGGRGPDAIMSASDMIKNIVKSIVFCGESRMAGAFWFFGVLFSVSVLYTLISFVIANSTNRFIKKRELITQTIISIIFLFIGYYYGIYNMPIKVIGTVMSSYIIYHLGRVISFLFSEYLNYFSNIFQKRYVNNMIGGA